MSPLTARAVGLVLVVGRASIGAVCELHVLRHVDDHRAGPAVRGDVERLVQDARQILDRLHEVVVLGAVAA